MLIAFFCYLCNVYVPSVLWYCWLGLLTCKNCLPYNLYCVGGDVKHCSIQFISNLAKPISLVHMHTLVFMCAVVEKSFLSYWRIGIFWSSTVWHSKNYIFVQNRKSWDMVDKSSSLFTRILVVSCSLSEVKGFHCHVVDVCSTEELLAVLELLVFSCCCQSCTWLQCHLWLERICIWICHG